MYWTHRRGGATLAAPMRIDPSAGGTAARPAPVTTPVASEPVTLPARLGHILSLDDFEVAARRHQPAPIFA
jgi:L-lactate dehydrogenase (cytochrome)